MRLSICPPDQQIAPLIKAAFGIVDDLVLIHQAMVAARFMMFALAGVESLKVMEHYLAGFCLRTPTYNQAGACLFSNQHTRGTAKLHPKKGSPEEAAPPLVGETREGKALSGRRRRNVPLTLLPPRRRGLCGWRRNASGGGIGGRARRGSGRCRGQAGRGRRRRG